MATSGQIFDLLLALIHGNEAWAAEGRAALVTAVGGEEAAIEAGLRSGNRGAAHVRAILPANTTPRSPVSLGVSEASCWYSIGANGVHVAPGQRGQNAQ
jgi:hypothetical protein